MRSRNRTKAPTSVDDTLLKRELRLATDPNFVSQYESGERKLDVLGLREVCHAIGRGFVDRELK